MAKVQTRRSVSLSRATHEAVVAAAARAGISVSEWVTQLIRVQCPELQTSIPIRRLVPEPVVVRVPDPPPPVPRAVIDLMAAQRRVPPRIMATLFCAVCADDLHPTDKPRMAPIGRNDALVRVCAKCDTHEPRSNYGTGRG